MKKYVQSILITATLSLVTANAEVDCVALSRTVTVEIAADESLVLEIVSKYVAAAPYCACEIIKSAIKATDADSKEVAAIVDAAITAAPDQLRLIVVCAKEIAPYATADIQAVLAKFGANTGLGNPLDVPGINPLGNPLASFSSGGSGGGTTGSGGGIGGGGLGSLLGGLPAGGLPGGFFGATPSSGGADLGGGTGIGGGIVNPPPITTPTPPRRPPGRPPVR